jgi:acetyl-CoA synthetase
MQTIWGDPDRFVDVYYSRYCKDKNSKDWRDWPYLAGDGAVEAKDGYYRILGRIDDVINVAGHRLGTKELESAALVVPEVAESAVVALSDSIKGIVPDVDASEDLRKRVSDAIVKEIGPIARPKNVWIVPDMPKTRSGKIMRRVLAAISNKQDVGDLTTLANPEVVGQIQAVEKA